MRWATSLAVCWLIGCNQAENSTSAIDAVATESDQSQAGGATGECKDSAERLAGSGVCRTEWQVALQAIDAPAGSLPDDCSWVLQETPFKDQYLLYLAASCEGTTSKLVHVGGADKETFFIETSALYEGPLQIQEGWAPITAIPSDPDSPTASLLAFTRAAMQGIGNSDECIVRPAQVEGWPEDAFVVDEASPTKTVLDGPRSACGTFGYTEESTAYWRVFGGFSWFFELGQDAYADIDPRTFTVIEPVEVDSP